MKNIEYFNKKVIGETKLLKSSPVDDYINSLKLTKEELTHKYGLIHISDLKGYEPILEWYIIKNDCVHIPEMEDLK